VNLETNLAMKLYKQFKSITKFQIRIRYIKIEPLLLLLLLLLLLFVNLIYCLIEYVGVCWKQTKAHVYYCKREKELHYHLLI